MVFRSMVAGTLLLGAMSGTLAQSGNLNLLTDLDSPFPHGCLSAELPEEAPVINRLLIGAEGDILAPTIQSTSRDGLLRIRSWRVACPDESHSVVLVRLS